MNLNLMWLIQLAHVRLGIACATLKEKDLLNHHQHRLVIFVAQCLVSVVSAAVFSVTGPLTILLEVTAA
jgi:hypothetical protein